MSYTKAMFHRIAEEAQRIAENEDTSLIDKDDLFVMADALARILADNNFKSLESQAASLVACKLGGMYEVFQELPDIQRDLIEALMEDEGYSYMANEWLSMWVKKED